MVFTALQGSLQCHSSTLKIAFVDKEKSTKRYAKVTNTYGFIHSFFTPTFQDQQRDQHRLSRY